MCSSAAFHRAARGVTNREVEAASDDREDGEGPFAKYGGEDDGSRRLGGGIGAHPNAARGGPRPRVARGGGRPWGSQRPERSSLARLVAARRSSPVRRSSATGAALAIFGIVDRTDFGAEKAKPRAPHLDPAPSPGDERVVQR